MRIVSLAISLAALTGCISGNWTHEGNIIAECEEGERLTYFYDADGDGWGEPYVDAGGSPSLARSVTACTAADAVTAMAALITDEEDIAVAVNNRDCDDSRADVTGRIGSICPDQLVPPAPLIGEIFFTPLSAAGHEIVIVHDDSVDEYTDQQWGDFAADACGPYGWGGGIMREELDPIEATGSLLSLVGQPGAIRDALTEALPVGVEVYAGWVGVVGVDRVPQDQVSGSEYWYWESVDSTTGQAVYTPHAELEGTIPYCFGIEPSSEYERLALVYDGASWCLGLPTDAPPAETASGSDFTVYEDARMAHFICQRPIPEGSDYAGSSDYGISTAE